MAAVTVEDANGVRRVTLGQIADGPPPDFGLKVVSSDGATTIIDGTSDMFKIAATGTITQGWPAAGNDSANSVTLTALGTFAVLPAMLFSQVWDNANTSNQRRLDNWFANNLTTGALVYRTYSEVFLNGSSQVVVAIHANSITLNPGGTAAGRYYVLIEVGI